MAKETRKWDSILLIGLSIIGIAIVILFVVRGISAVPEKKGAAYFKAFEMILGTLLLFIPSFVKKVFKLDVPNMLKVLFWIFIYCAVFIGTGFGYYSKITYWDKLLHVSSAMLLVALGFAIMGIFVKHELAKEIHPAFFAVFAFCFGLAMGVFWEYYEFSFDGFLGLNMQRFATSGGKSLIGRDVLMDTMGDLFINGLGCLIFAVYGFVKMKQDSHWLERAAFKKIKAKTS